MCELYNSYQYGLKGDARTAAVNPIRDTYFASDPGLYYTVGNACTMAAWMVLPVGGSMTAAVNAGTSPVRAGLTELGMLGYSSVMAAESADIVTDITDSKLAGMFAGTIVAMGSYGGLKSLDQSVNISGLYPPKEAPNSYAELMAPEEAERYLKFLENGSMEGLTDAEIAAIRKVDDALALQKVDGQSVLDLKRPVTTGESGGTPVLTQKDVMMPTLPQGSQWERNVLNSFSGGKATPTTYEGGTTLYRIGGKNGGFWSLDPPPVTEYQWRVDYAIKQEFCNDASTLYKMTIPEGSSLGALEGKVGTQGMGLYGGAHQAYIDYRAVPSDWIEIAPTTWK